MVKKRLIIPIITNIPKNHIEIIVSYNFKEFKKTNPSKIGIIPYNYQIIDPDNSQIIDPDNSQIIDPDNSQIIDPESCSLFYNKNNITIYLKHDTKQLMNKIGLEGRLHLSKIRHEDIFEISLKSLMKVHSKIINNPH